MDAARPLRDVFVDLASGGADSADPAQLLRDSGHPDLPGHLVAEAVVNFADTAPIEVAEHLSPYVMAQTAVAGADPGEVESDDWLEAFTGTPAGTDSDPGALDDLVVPNLSPVSTEDFDPPTFGDGGHPTTGTPPVVTDAEPTVDDSPDDLDDLGLNPPSWESEGSSDDLEGDGSDVDGSDVDDDDSDVDDSLA
jgi:hypothetical protein